MNDEMKKTLLEDAKIINPLSLKWLKRDFLTPLQAILVYYGIEPSNDDFQSKDLQVIRRIDYLGAYDALMNSEFILRQQDGIKFSEFLEWLEKKRFGIFDHLKPLINKGSSLKKDEVLNFALLALDIDQINKLRPCSLFRPLFSRQRASYL